MERNIRSYEDDVAYISNCLMKILEWTDISVAHLARVISLTAGLLMWMTSLYPMKRNKFELFIYTHQLYVIFTVFFLLCMLGISFSVYLLEEYFFSF